MNWDCNLKKKNMSRRQEEEKTKMKKTKRKSSKQIAYLTVKIVKLSKRKYNALSNGQIGVFKMSIVFGLNIIQISAKVMCNKLIPY